MAQTFVINGTTLTRVGAANWSELPEAEIFNGKMAKNRWRGLRLGADVVAASEFDVLFALEGGKVALTCPNYSDRNGDYKTYYGVDFLSIRGEHNGPVVENIQIELMVRL
jgi:hypothetical protein